MLLRISPGLADAPDAAQQSSASADDRILYVVHPNCAFEEL